MNNLKGMVTIEVLDAKTLEVKRTTSQTNVVGIQLFFNDMSGIAAQTSWNSTATTDKCPAVWISVSGRSIQSGNKSLSWRGCGHESYPSTSSYPAVNYDIRSADDNVHGWQYTAGSPSFMERKDRFNSPTTVQTINSIFLTEYKDQDGVGTSIALNTPCIQNPGEVLDITYRMQFYATTSVNTDGAWVSDALYQDGYVATRKLHSQYCAYPNYVYAAFQGLPVDSPYNEFKRFTIWDDDWLESLDTSEERIFSFDHFKNIFYVKQRKQDMNGTIIGTTHFAGNTQGNHWSINQGSNPSVYPCAEMALPLLPADSPFTPIQPIQNHNKDAIEWGLDVDYLASSQGSLNVNGDNWTNPDWPEFWRIDITKSGAVGVSNYHFRNRRFVGFHDEFSFRPKRTLRSADMMDGRGDPTRTSGTRPHGAHSMESNEEYGADSYVSYDATGINLHFINKPNIIAYDATTIPALNVVNLRQVAVTDNGDIWVACRDTGLYRIENPSTPATAVITKMSDASNGLLALSEGKCMGVAVGSSNSIWAVMNGTLVHTTNPTDATPTFANYHPSSTIVFDWPAITASWGSVKYLKVDRNSVDNELAVMYRTGDNEKLIWWSLAGNTIEGPESGSFVVGNPDYFWWTGEQIGNVDVSRKGNLWARIGPAFSDNVQQLEWGTMTTDDLTLRNAGGFSRPMFFYDYYDNVFIGNKSLGYQAGTSTASREGYCLMSIDENIYSRSGEDYFETSNQHTPGLTWQNKRASGMFVSTGHTNYSFTEYQHGFRPDSMVQMAPDGTEFYLDSLNGQHSPFEELCWDKFHWNGSTWLKDYYTPAVDTSGGTAFPAVRHNFDTESHYFTGRSMIDASNAFTANNFGAAATATFAFTIQPNQKWDSTQDGGTYSRLRSKKQDFQQTLFDFSTPTRQFKFGTKAFPSATPIMALYEDDVEHEVSSTPLQEITSGAYRVVIVVTTTTATAYVDGVQLGTPMTLSGPYDWTNVAGDMKAYIGSRAYDWSHPQRHSTREYEFFRGEMTNVQFWNVAWDTADISNDMGNINGVITSKPIGNLIARYELTQSLEGLETKATHVANELLDEGITIGFADGTGPTAFVATDYFTFGVCEGVLKDNSISFTREVSLYHKPVDHAFTEFKNESDSSVIEGASSAQVLEPAVFKADWEVTNTGNNSQSGQDLTMVYQYPGHLYRGDFNGFNTVSTYQWQRGGWTHQRIDGDGYFEAKAAAADTHCMIGLIQQTTIGFNDFSQQTRQVQTPYNIMLEPNGYFSIVESGNIVVADAATYTLDTIFRIKKTGTSITYHTETNSVETLIHTSANASTSALFGVVDFPYGGMGVVDAKISCTRLDNMLTIGNSSTNTGWFNTKFLRTDAIDISSYSIQIDGIEADVIAVDNDTYEFLPTPTAGQVVMLSKTGKLVFNDLDIGKTVTGRVTVIYDEL